MQTLLTRNTYSIKQSKTLQPVVLLMEMLSAVLLRPLPSHGMLRVPSHPAAQVQAETGYASEDEPPG